GEYRRHPPGLRGHDPRADRGAARSEPAAAFARPLRAEPRRVPAGLLPPWLAGERARLRGQLAVAVRDRVRRMRPPAQEGAPPAELDVRMVVLGLGQLADPVHEGERLGEVRELELPL